MFSSEDRSYMKKALQLAGKAEGLVSPNPLVGAVVVNNGKVVGTGYHKQYKGPHAEPQAIQKAGKKAKGATLYVSLEPCCHWGNTPPCTEAILDSGIKRVVFAMKDPNPLVKKCSGTEDLRARGIQVEEGLLTEEARELNRKFIKFITINKPYVTLKLASTLDGRTADYTGNSKWISSEASRHLVHEMRFAHDAICVGVTTVIKDNPLLTIRLLGKAKPLIRVILDKHFDFPVGANLLNHPDPILIFIDEQFYNREKAEKLKKQNAEILPITSEHFLDDVLSVLGERKIASLFVEGGATVANSFLIQKLFDEFYLFIAPKVLGDKAAQPLFSSADHRSMEDAFELTLHSYKRIGSDMLLVYR